MKKSLMIILAFLGLILVASVMTSEGSEEKGFKQKFVNPTEPCVELVEKFLDDDKEMIEKLLKGDIPPHIMKRKDGTYIINKDYALYIINETALIECQNYGKDQE